MYELITLLALGYAGIRIGKGIGYLIACAVIGKDKVDQYK